MTANAHLLHWLPPLSNFRQVLSDVRTESSSEKRRARLTWIAEHQLDFLQTIQVDRALREAFVEPPAGLRVVRVAILGSVTVEHLFPAIRVGGLRRGLWIELYSGGFGQYRQELLDPNSELYRFQPSVILFALDARGAVESIPLGVSGDFVVRRISELIDEYRSFWTIAREKLHASVIQHSFLNVADSVFGQYDGAVDAAPAAIVDRLNLELNATAAREGTLILDIARYSRRLGSDTWFDAVRWFQAKQELAPVVVPLYGDLVARMLAAQLGLSRKCLVLDLDNTLWGGVIGDDGIDGIVLGQGSPAGEAYAAFQRYVKRLSERGVILAVSSKNESEIAEAVFRDHPEMVLKRSDIAAVAINWNDKASNLREIASTLNIGLDSLVFFDDNPVERALVRNKLPMVAVPEVPEDPAQFTRCLADAGYFEAVAFTADDRQRTQQYVENLGRESLRQSAGGIEDFLRSLDMRLDARPFQKVDLARVTQLVNKTNQFNVRTQRYSQEEIAAVATDPSALTLQVRVADKFGDNGLVAVAILRPERSDEPENLFIETWLMSCRVIGRMVEMDTCNRLVAAARERGAVRLIGEYLPTPKNHLVRDLFVNLGFSPLANGDQNRANRWELLLADYVPHRTWFQPMVETRHG